MKRKLIIDRTLLQSISLSKMLQNVDLAQCCLTKGEINIYVQQKMERLLEKDTSTLFLFKLSGTFFVFLVYPSLKDPTILRKQVRDIDSKTMSQSYRFHRLVRPE